MDFLVLWSFLCSFPLCKTNIYTDSMLPARTSALLKWAQNHLHCTKAGRYIDSAFNLISKYKIYVRKQSEESLPWLSLDKINVKIIAIHCCMNKPGSRNARWMWSADGKCLWDEKDWIIPSSVCFASNRFSVTMINYWRGTSYTG